ncbi:hypothetical protein ACH4GZ_38865 [Streptomyces hygroscopicus]|uniref:hypothetical protein n=1 Tax=Streptomyces hygroscopicus TaxID=1912 RepID=UPI0037A9B89C
MAGVSEREHGTYVKYKLDGCRCYPCCFADSEYRRNRERAIAYGTWQPFVDAEPVRAHVRSLMEFGIGWKRLAALAGVPTGAMSKLLYGDQRRNMAPSKQIRPRTAAALLAVEPSLENLGSVVAVDATGTRRRLQALIRAGWPKAQLAKRLGMLPSNFGDVLTRPQVTVRTVRAVMRLYDELWQADPREHGVDNQAYSRTVNYASKLGWAPVGAWDDDTIDDPATVPDWTGKCGTSDGYDAHYNMRILPACRPCRDARAAHRRERRRAGRVPRMAEAA